MPRFENSEPRIRGFNGNKIVFAPGEVKELSSDDVKFLVDNDLSFKEVIQNGLLRDLDNAAGLKKGDQQKPAPQTLSQQAGTGANVEALLMQIKTLPDENAIAAFAQRIPTMSKDDADAVKNAMLARRDELTDETKKKAAKK